MYTDVHILWVDDVGDLQQEAIIIQCWKAQGHKHLAFGDDCTIRKKWWWLGDGEIGIGFIALQNAQIQPNITQM